MDFSQLKQLHPKLEQLEQRPIAYFCAEFALNDKLPIFSGGLGILAGDVIRQAEEWQLPVVGIGLLYKEGYFKQIISNNTEQVEMPAYADLENLPIKKALSSDGQQLSVELHIGQRVVHVQIWEYWEGKTKVLLLDTDLEKNSDSDRRLTLNLYPKDSEWRIQQEMILGIGGVKALYKLGYKPSLFHLNEGHSAFAVIEISHQHMKQTGLSYDECISYARSRTVFTNHTLLPSGNDVFEFETVTRLIGDYSNHLGLEVAKLLEAGRTSADSPNFSMTNFALAESEKTSAVSRTHARIAKELWPNINFEAITNGVNQKFWQAKNFFKLSTKIQGGTEILNSDIWKAHQHNKESMLQEILKITGISLDPTALTICWARRIATYKQPMLLFSDLAKLSDLTNSNSKPVQIVIAGKAHPSDTSAKAMISELLNTISKHKLAEKIIFLPNYSLSLAQTLVSGSDVWLNTPIKGQEACGTSGMKAALNGVLQLAISDGWTDEVDLKEIGFELSANGTAIDIYQKLEHEVAPLYYQRTEQNLPEMWIEKMKNSLAVSTKNYTSERMLLQYLTNLYLPVIS